MMNPLIIEVGRDMVGKLRADLYYSGVALS